jgi:hypothetical protein
MFECLLLTENIVFFQHMEQPRMLVPTVDNHIYLKTPLASVAPAQMINVAKQNAPYLPRPKPILPIYKYTRRAMAVPSLLETDYYPVSRSRSLPFSRFVNMSSGHNYCPSSVPVMRSNHETTRRNLMRSANQPKLQFRSQKKTKASSLSYQPSPHECGDLHIRLVLSC